MKVLISFLFLLSTTAVVAQTKQHSHLDENAERKMSSYKVSPPSSLKTPLKVPQKLLLGAGPSNYPERVRTALSYPVLGHLHPETLEIMDDIKDGLRYIFQTSNEATMCITGTGHAGMEAIICNLLEDGDVILIGSTGIWGHRAAEMARRYGADVRMLEAPLGESISISTLRNALQEHKPKVYFTIQGDSSTGIWQDVQAIGDLCHSVGVLTAVDTVASLGGVEFRMDEWKIDAVYTGSQKVLGAPAGITPISFSPKAIEAIRNRRSKVKVYYFDALMLGDYWGCFGNPRFYHHTGSAVLYYGLREALALASEEGLESLIQRHQATSERFQQGIEALGLEMFVKEKKSRLPTVNAVRIPDGIDPAKISTFAARQRVEIAGGLGPTVGKIVRVGFMGVNAHPEMADRALQVLKDALEEQKGAGRNAKL